MQSFLKILGEVLKTFLTNLSKSKVQPVPAPINLPPTPQPVPPPVIVPPAPEPAPAPVVPTSTGFLICPVKLNDANGRPVTSRTAKITAVIDHMGTAIDPSSNKPWGLNAKDQKTRSFNGEVGDGDPCAGTSALGYAKKVPSPFFSAGEINYVGAPGAGDKYGPTFYLNYDGHAGYDFKCIPGTQLIAPADGDLFKAQTDPIDGVNRTWALKNLGLNNPTAWEGWHSFYIKHANSYVSWLLHCTKLVDEIEAQLTDYTKSVAVKEGQIIAYSGGYGGVGPHLHFEVRNSKGKIVDPYQDKLWKDY